jgi:hypothetical protein
MSQAAFACPKCQTAFELEPSTWDVAAQCPNCQSELEAHFFPAFFRPETAETAAAALTDAAEASCFYHPQKQAAAVCDGCGRMICSLCSIDMGAEHLCPACISAGKKKGKLVTLEKTRVRYDSIALSLAVFGVIGSIFALVAGPAAIYLSIRHWNSPGSLPGGRGPRGRFVLAILIGSGAFLLWVTILGAAIFGAHPHLHHHQ